MMIKQEKLISVLMSVYNTPEEYLRAAIESILNQSYRNFEFIIIDDCSNNETKKILGSYTDQRIKIHSNTENKGLTKSLNIGLELCKGDYIARMDSDDIAYPERLEIQLKYIEEKEYAVIGSEYEFYPQKQYKRFITDNLNKQRIRMIFSNVGIIHSTAFMDRKQMTENKIAYNETYKKSQDYGLWCDYLRKGFSLGNCPVVLLKWRESPNQISRANAAEQKDCRDRIRKEYIHDLFVISEESSDYLIKHFDGNMEIDANTFKKISDILLELIKQNTNIQYMEKEICRIWLIQIFRIISLKKLSKMLLNKMTYKAMKPTNLLYFLMCYFKEKHVYY